MDQTTPEVMMQESSPVYFSVSKPKLIVMSLCTFGIYEIYWFFKNWKLVKERTGQNISPFWRAVFPIFFCYSLFNSIQHSANSHGVLSRMRPGWLAFSYIALGVSWKLPGSAWLISFLTFLPLLLVQEVINDINVKVAPDAEFNSKFSWKNIIVIIIGGILLFFSVLGIFMPEIV